MAHKFEAGDIVQLNHASITPPEMVVKYYTSDGGVLCTWLTTTGFSEHEFTEAQLTLIRSHET